MNCANWYESWLIFSDEKSAFAASHLCSTSDNHPMLSSMMMHLCWETFTRLNGNTLYLITVATFYRIITSPRTIDFAMGYMFATFLLFKNFDNLLYVLYVVLLCYQERIFSLNYNKVINSYSADQWTFRVNVVVPAVIVNYIAMRYVFMFIFLWYFPKWCPWTDVTPVSIKWNNYTILSFFHYRIINWLIGTFCKDIRI